MIVTFVSATAAEPKLNVAPPCMTAVFAEKVVLVTAAVPVDVL